LRGYEGREPTINASWLHWFSPSNL
jgi:hypothetical protein